ncbi:hypothetical protein [Flavobacterium sp. N502540]|uniref:hypothetical protein n=1 Tax=Flavobacterium sp. N502540 TaxID=2986838 RepID=UPI002224828A|nr:hypothetical protein [Flavobacterium sp. N502540]
MKKNQIKGQYIFLLILFLNAYIICGQTNNEILVYNWFDKNLGVESLEFENGPAHLNFDKTVNNENRYYISEDFRKGSMQYNNQNYSDLLLNYDTYTDELVIKPYGELNTTKINLFTENISSFKIGNDKFVHLDVPNSTTFRKGYYEEVPVGNNIILYIKHSKEKKKSNKAEVDLIGYTNRKEFILLKQNNFYPVNDKKEIISLFQENKRKINDFYLMYRNLRKEDAALFMKNLLKYINN